MKAIIVFFLLLASVFFLPSSTLARQLLQKGKLTTLNFFKSHKHLHNKLAFHQYII
ncbi:hypothetical protein GLYMA_08G339500v4 [Glycine max]|nr:hypothetical protein GLYMA_08G339500v4 [Glycine max]KAH1054422.1 hypothetical protein GYH30_023274 [Glycine max]